RGEARRDEEAGAVRGLAAVDAEGDEQADAGEDAVDLAVVVERDGEGALAGEQGFAEDVVGDEGHDRVEIAIGRTADGVAVALADGRDGERRIDRDLELAGGGAERGVDAVGFVVEGGGGFGRAVFVDGGGTAGGRERVREGEGEREGGSE